MESGYVSETNFTFTVRERLQNLENWW